MRVKTKDQLHVSSVRAETFRKDEEFDVSDPIGKELVARGLVTKVAPKKGDGGKKAAPKPQNKAAPKPQNKAAPKPENKSA